MKQIDLRKILSNYLSVRLEIALHELFFMLLGQKNFDQDYFNFTSKFATFRD